MRTHGSAHKIAASNSGLSSQRKSSSEFKTFLATLASSVSSKRVFLSALAAIFFLAPGLAHAQAPVTDDTYSQRGREWTNGGAPVVVVQSPNVNSYLRFNLSVFPPNLQSGEIEKATLKLFVNSVQGAGTMYVCRLQANQGWDEKTLIAGEPACDPSTDAIPVLMTKDMILNYVVIDVTPIARYWYENPGSNNGIGLFSTNPSTSAASSSRPARCRAISSTLSMRRAEMSISPWRYCRKLRRANP